MMKELYEGMNICVSVKALYDMEKDLLLGHIVPDFEDNEKVYYDLYNEYGELACLDGELCWITQIGNGLVSFRNDNGEGSVYFALTTDEAKVACFA